MYGSYCMDTQRFVWRINIANSAVHITEYYYYNRNRERHIPFLCQESFCIFEHLQIKLLQYFLRFFIKSGLRKVIYHKI